MSLHFRSTVEYHENLRVWKSPVVHLRQLRQVGAANRELIGVGSIALTGDAVTDGTLGFVLRFSHRYIVGGPRRCRNNCRNSYYD